MVDEVALQRVYRRAHGAAHVKWINFIISLPSREMQNFPITGPLDLELQSHIITRANRNLRPYSTSHAQML